MEKFIEVYDNVLSNYLENKIESLILDYATQPRFPLYYQPNNTFSPTHPNFSLDPGLVNCFKGGLPNAHSDFLSQVLYSFCFKNNIILYEFFQGKVYVDLPSPKPGLNLPPHIDMHGQNHWVLLYYINDSDGDTVLFKDDQKTEIKRVSPKKGRIVFFNGSIPHCGSKSLINTRSVINIDFIGEKL